MKKILLLLISCYSMVANGQNLVSPISITLPSNPPSNTADWATAIPSLRIIAQAKTTANGQISPLVVESRILVTIKASGGNKVCGIYNQQNAPSSGFNSASKTWAGAAALGLLGQDCVLPPGTYQLCVQFYGLNAAQAGLLGEGCSKTFTIVDTKQQTYSPPQNVQPADGKEFTKEEAKQPINFRWTPVLPKPKDKVKYTVRIWEVPEGSNKNQIIKTQSPSIIKETNEQTQLTIPASQFKLGRRENLYAWNVQASKQTQLGDVEMLGTSEATSFSASSGGCQIDYTASIDSFKCLDNNQYKICATIKINQSGYGTSSSSYTAYPTKVLQWGIYDQTLTQIGSSFPININKTEGQTYQVCQIITFPLSITSIKIKFDGQVQTPNPAFDNCNGSATADSIKPECKCNLCDEKYIGWEIQSELYYDSLRRNNTLTLHNDIAVNPALKVVKLSAELVDFYWYTEGDCKKCEKNDYNWGNLISGYIKGSGFIAQGVAVTDENGVPLVSSHQLDFISRYPSGTNLSADTYLNISLPAQTQLSCCTDCFRFCVRYTITYMQNGVCKTCSIVKCYETKRHHRKTGKPQLQVNSCGESVIHQGGSGVFQQADGIKKD